MMDIAFGNNCNHNKLNLFSIYTVVLFISQLEILKWFLRQHRLFDSTLGPSANLKGIIPAAYTTVGLYYVPGHLSVRCIILSASSFIWRYKNIIEI